MRRLFAVMLGLMLGLTPLMAQDSPAEREAPTENIRWEIAPEQIHRNIHFLIDRSGSMNANQIASAMSTFLTVAEQAVDEINIAVTIFGKDAKRWDGVPDERTPKKWAALPSLDNVNAAKAWMRETTIDSSCTKLEEAIATIDERIVERPGADINEITVIVISDLLFDNFPNGLTAAFQAKHQARTINGARRISIGFIGIHSNPGAITNIKALCEQDGPCRGSWLAVVEKIEEEEEDVDPAPAARPAPGHHNQHGPLPPAPPPDPPDPLVPPDPNFPH